jgi:TldD protein
MREVIAAALQAAGDAGADYADARVVEARHEQMSVANGRLDALEQSESAGVGIRVLVDGAWGFASVNDLAADEVARIAADAVAIGRASTRVADRRVELSPLEPQTGSWSGPCMTDPFSVPVQDKLQVLTSTDEALRASGAVEITEVHYGAHAFHTWFGSTEGSLVEQEWTEAGAGAAAFVVGDGEVLTRSYPKSHGGAWQQGGWEYVEALDLPGNAERTAGEAIALLSAEECPSGHYDLIIDAGQLALQVHESVGHPTELDRVLGEETAFAGTSWVGLQDLGSLRYGSEHMTVSADATHPASLGSFGWDDEGVPAQRDLIVDRGVLTGFMTSRETAPAIGRASNGCMRADGWNRIPLVRMTTVSLEPGDWSFDKLVADTTRGLYVETNNSWSIDDRRLNFQFACEIGWLIENGEMTRMVKRPNYTGITPQFWASLDAVCSRDHWAVYGLPNCGKGEPVQIAHVAHGAAPARFRNVQVGVGR